MLDKVLDSSQDTIEDKKTSEMPALRISTAQVSGMTPARPSVRSLRQQVININEGSAPNVDVEQVEDEDDIEESMTIKEAFTDIILQECKESPLGTCLMREMQRFVEILDLYRPIADFQITQIFKLSRFEEGLPKSIILQKEKLDQQKQQRESEQQRVPSVTQSMLKNKSVAVKQSGDTSGGQASAAAQQLAQQIDSVNAGNNQLRRITLPYSSPIKQQRRKPIKNSLLIALCKLNPTLSRTEQQKSYEEILDELTCYIERTIQLFWLNHKIGLFARNDSQKSLVFRLYRQGKDHFKLTMLKLKHRLKMSSLLLLQMCPDDALVEKVKGMNHHELLALRVHLMEALNSSEYTINLDATNVSSQVINKVLQNQSVATMDSAVLRSSEPTSPDNHLKPPGGDTKKIHLDLDVAKIHIQNQNDTQEQNESLQTSPRVREDAKEEKSPQQVAQDMRKNLVSLLQSNLIIHGCQLTTRKQLGHVLNKYFSGYQSGISIDLFSEAIEYHYEGLDQNSKSVLKRGISDLLTECGQSIHRDELFQAKPLNVNTQGTLISTQKSQDDQGGRIVTVHETLNGMSMAESDQYNSFHDNSAIAQELVTQNISARTGSQDEINQVAAAENRLGNSSPRKQDSSGRNLMNSKKTTTSNILQPGSGGINPPLARKVKTNPKVSQQRRKETQRQESVAEIIEKARLTEVEIERGDNQQGGFHAQMSVQEATHIANKANEDLKPIKFVGQFENVSKWIPRNCSVYADQTNQVEQRQEPAIIHIADSMDTVKKANVINMKNMQEKLDKEKEQQMYIDAKKPTALFGSHSSGLHTSIDTMDVQMMADPLKESNERLNALNYKKTIQLQDLIMLTDMYSVPHLLTLFSRSQLSQKEIEYQVQSQIPHQADFALTRRVHKRTEVSVVIPYNGATIGFVLTVLTVFGVCQLKFCKSSEKVKVVKIKLDGMVMSKQELLQIVHKIELIFHMAEFSQEYSSMKAQRTRSGLDSHAGGLATSSIGADLQVEKKLFSERDRLLLQMLMIQHNRKEKKMAIKKTTYEAMQILEIQNYLSRDYHFFKWHLVEILEVQEREIASYGFKKQFSDIVNFMRQQQMDKSMELGPGEKALTISALNTAINQMQIQRKTISIKEETANRYASESQAGQNINDYIQQVRQKVNAIQPGDLTNQASQESLQRREEPFRDKHSAALKASPGVQQLQRLVECIQLSQLQVKHIDFMNRLLKKKEKSTQLSLKCRNITQDELTAMQEAMDLEKEKLEISKKQSQQRLDAIGGDVKANIANQTNSKLALAAKRTSNMNVPGFIQGSDRKSSFLVEPTEGQQDTKITDTDREVEQERHPLLPLLNYDEIILEEVSISSKLDALSCHKMNQCFLWHKQALIARLHQTESLLVCIDKRMYQQRVALVNLLKYVGGGIEIRENFIKKQLAQIAALEMQKSKDEDLLSEQTLKTIEIVNIADIAIEKKNLETQIANLGKQAQELEFTEMQIGREKKRREDKKAAREANKKSNN